MALINSHPQREMHVSSALTTASKYIYFWFTSYVPCIAMDSAIASLKVKNCQGNVEITPVVQFAPTRSDSPSAPLVVNGGTGFTPITTDNEYVVTAANYALSASTPGNTYVRFGVGVRVTAAGTGTADVTMHMHFLQLGQLLAPWSGHAHATSTTVMFTPISGWLAAHNITAFVAAIVMANRTGNYQLDIVYRTASTSPESADAWSAGQLAALINANGETCSLERSLSLGNKMWVQFGVVSSLSSGTTPGQADISVLVGIRQAT